VSDQNSQAELAALKDVKNTAVDVDPKMFEKPKMTAEEKTEAFAEKLLGG